MKTAISIDDKIFEQAEIAAKELGITRSSLYTQAVQEFIKNHLPNAITDKYNQVYSNIISDEEINRIAYNTLSKVEW